MADIFLSYAHEDKERARALVTALEHDGFKIWWDHDIPVGETWEEMIAREIGAANCVMVLWSEISVRKIWVKDEARTAKRLHRPLCPVLLDAMEPPMGFGDIQCANLAGWHGNRRASEYLRLVDAVRASIPVSKPAVEAPPPVAPLPSSDTAPPPPPAKTLFPRWLLSLAAFLVLAGSVWALWARVLKPAETLNPHDGQRYRRISAGTFEMGCRQNCKDDELPVRTVAITKDFWIGETEVTAGAWAKYAKAQHLAMPPQTASSCGDPSKFNPQWKLEDHPIVNVSWEDAQRYCSWIGGSLPTEAQWEYAARGGASGLMYPWGDFWISDRINHGAPIKLPDGSFQLHSYSSSNGDHWDYTAPVRSFAPNGFGLFDMLGNVQEWCLDAYRPYDPNNTRDPFAAPTSGENRVARGGSYDYGPQDCRLSNRNQNPPDGRYPDSGFRCVAPIR